MKFRNQLLLGYAMVLGLMVLMAAVSFQSSRYLLRTQQQVDRAHETMTTGRLVQKSMVDMQTAVRGYFLVGEEPYLQPFEQGKAAYEQAMNRLKEMVFDDPAQLDRLEEVEALIAQWINTAALPGIEARRDVLRGEAAWTHSPGSSETKTWGEASS